MSSDSCSARLDASSRLLAALLNPPEHDVAHWTVVASLSLGVFNLVTAECLPTSLLNAMAADLHVSVGTADQAVTATALTGGLLVAAFQIAIAAGAIGGGLLVDHAGVLGAPAFTVVAVTLGTMLTGRWGRRAVQA